MSLITLSNIELSFGADPILDQANLIIESGDRLGLIGRNGAGKSSLLKVIGGEVTIDGGERKVQQNTVISRLIQEVPEHSEHTVGSLVALGNADVGQILSDYYRHPSDELQFAITDADGWVVDQDVKRVCSQFELDPSHLINDLSGGRKRRALVAQAMVSNPDVLLLDEPTNHLDIDSIEWLESLISNLRCAQVIISHDRRFIDATCQHIIELDRGQLTRYPGNYSQYLKLKQKADEEEDRANKKFDKKLAQEEVWIRKGIQARRTRNEGRVRALKRMRDERRQRRERMGTAQFSLQKAQQSGKIVIETKDLSHDYGNGPVINALSTRILRGDRVGLIGPNGCGKSTLIKLLTGELEPSQGRCKIGSNVEVAYLDQYRSAIKDSLSVQDNVSGETEITINGQRKHILGYLQEFLFTPARARAPAAKLSGGERNRLLLAKLFTRSFNLLVLDEPTNDLDFETLELLEQRLLEFEGTLLLVSHDRAFLDNVVTNTLAFEGQGRVREYVGGFSDWLEQRPSATASAGEEPLAIKEPLAGKEPSAAKKPSTNKKPSNSEKPHSQQPARTKLSYKLQRELDALPAEIERLEQRIAELSEQMFAPEFYAQPQVEISQHANTLKEAQAALEACFERWETLENG